MKTTHRLVSVLAAAGAAGLLVTPSASAAAPQKFSFSSSGVSADAAFTNAPLDGPPVVGKVYTDVFVSAADWATTTDGTTYSDDFAYVDVFSYKVDRRGQFVQVSSSSGYAGNDDVTFAGDAKRLSSASLTADVAMSSCNERGCTDAGTAQVSVSWSGSGATTTYRGTVRTNEPGQFTSSGRFSGTSRGASASGTVPALGSATAVWASISSGSHTERTICSAC